MTLPNAKWSSTARYLLVCLLQFGLVGPHLSARQTKDSFDAEKQLGMLESAIDSIWSYDVYVATKKELYITKTDPGDRTNPGSDWVLLKEPIIKIARSRQVYEKGKRRIEMFDATGSRAVEVVGGDMMQERVWNSKAFQATIRAPRLNIFEPGADYSDTYRAIMGPLSIVAVLRDRTNTVIRRNDTNGQLVYEANPQPNTRVDLRGQGYSISASASQNMLPVVIERYRLIDGQKVLQSRTNISHKKLANGLIVPISAVTEQMSSRQALGPAGSTVVGRLSLTVDEGRSRWNVPISDDTFHVAVPAGARVIDSIRNVSYVTGDPDPGKNLDTIATKARNVITDVIPPIPPEMSFWERWQRSVIVGCLFILTIGFFIVLRRRLTKAHS